jgi:hypothetical protein
MHVTTVSASFKQGIKMVSSRFSVVIVSFGCQAHKCAACGTSSKKDREFTFASDKKRHFATNFVDQRFRIFVTQDHNCSHSVCSPTVSRCVCEVRHLICHWLYVAGIIKRQFIEM